MDSFTFTPTEGFNDASIYTNPGSETETRRQLFTPHEQTRDYINNNVVPVVSELQTDVEALKAATGDPEAIQEIMDAVAQIQSFLNIANAAAYVE